MSPQKYQKNIFLVAISSNSKNTSMKSLGGKMTRENYLGLSKVKSTAWGRNCREKKAWRSFGFLVLVVTVWGKIQSPGFLLLNGTKFLLTAVTRSNFS